MAAFAGTGGTVTFASGHTVNVFSWSIDYTAEALESTDFASGGNREFIPGLKGWSGSYECRLDSADTVDAPGAAPAGAVFTGEGAATTYSGDIMITSVSLSVAVDGLASVTFSFQGSGTLAIT